MRTEVLEEFSVIGQNTMLTRKQMANIEIGERFWIQFNQNLKKNYLSLHGNWLKYAFTYKRDDQFYYYCAIPKPAYSPDAFLQKEISEKTYLVIDHQGDMNTIYKTYQKIYKEILPETGWKHDCDDFYHFERYDSRFHWNRSDSIIEIWVPVVICQNN